VHGTKENLLSLLKGPGVSLCLLFQKNKMRIPKAWVPLIAQKITHNIISKKLAKATVPIEKLAAETEQLLLEELAIEDRINDEVRELLKTYSSDIEKGRLDYRKLFDLTKQKLVRERNIVL